MMRRVIAVLTVLLVLPAGIMALGGQDETAAAQGGEPRVIQAAALNGPSGIGMVKLFAENPDLGDGVTAAYEVVLSPNEMMAKLLEGSVDIAALPVNMPALLNAKGAPYALGAVTGNGLIYTVSTDSSITSFADLKGKTVHTISPNATPDILTRYLLQENGLTPGEDVTLDFSYGHTELAQALIAGLVETASLPEPFITMVTMKNPDLKVVLDYQEEFRRVQGSDQTYPITAIAVRKDLAEEYPEAVRAFFEAYRESIRWVKANPQEAGVLVQEQGFTLPPAVTAAAMDRLNLTFLTPAEARDAVESFYTLLAGINPKTIGGGLPGDDFYLDW